MQENKTRLVLLVDGDEEMRSKKAGDASRPGMLTLAGEASEEQQSKLLSSRWKWLCTLHPFVAAVPDITLKE